MKRITINGVLIEYIHKKSDRKTISAFVNNDDVLEIRTPYGVNDDYVRKFITLNGGRILHMLEKSRQVKEYENGLGISELNELKRRAEEVIPERVKYFSEIMGVKPNRVRINSAKTRFGSCSGKGNLNFSCRVMAYSANAVDYVVIHELAHLIHLNHSTAFWTVVEKYKPDFRDAKRELRKTKSPQNL